jgi:hypothetical protein
MIYPPYVELEYEEKTVADIKASAVARFTEVEFIAENFMDPKGFWSLATSAFWTLCVILALAVCLFVGISSKAERLTTDATASTQLAAFRGITTSLSLFSSFFFWYLFAMCAWWFIFYKLQERVYCLLPPLGSFEDNYVQYEGMLIALTVCKALSIFYKIAFEQSVLDIFLIDWESPRMYQYARHAPK